MGWQAEADGKSEGSIVMTEIDVELKSNRTSRESEQTSINGV